ncbi:MAG: shikimate kinase [Desulforhopalus sp.]|jgi:shikimate kinase
MVANIILIGFMGVGKGRTARELARQTGRYTIDTDDLIESATSLKIKKIFEQQGEPAFRKLEQQLSLWLQNSVSNTVVSTGGGFFMVDNIKQLGTVIHLHSSLGGILQAIMSHTNAEKKIRKRPLLQNLENAKTLYNTRLPLYREAASHSINIEGKDIEDVAREIVALL